MRKISTNAARAFINYEDFKLDNTCVLHNELRLHDNPIARRVFGGIEFSLCGWNTLTTRDRLNTLFRELGWPIRVVQKDFEPYIFDIARKQMLPIDPHESYTYHLHKVKWCHRASEGTKLVEVSQ